MTEHTLIYKHSADRPLGVDALRDWSVYERHSEPIFRRRYGVDQIADLTIVAVSRAIEAGRNITVGWGPVDPASTPADQLESAFRSLRPLTIICREQPRRADRWIVADLGATPTSLPRAAIQSVLSQTVETLYPRWRPRGENWSATALLVRHDVTALDLGLVEPYQLGPDDRLNLIADDPAVRAANRRSDPDVPESMHALISARLAAQAAIGIPEQDRTPVHTTECETLLLPHVFKMGRGDGPGVLAFLRKDLRRRYGESGDIVLAHALRIYPHGGDGIEQLRQAARESETTAAPAA